MKVSEFAALVRSVTYKPGEVLKLKPLGNGSYEIDFTRVVPDSRDPSQTIDIHHTNHLTRFQIEAIDEDFAKELIYSRIVEAEIHEAQEFLKFGGVQYRDPHGGRKD